VIIQNILAKDLTFADDHVILARTEDALQRAANTLTKIAIKNSLKNLKAMAVKGKMNLRTK
jgi:hypothetical protein